jgi:ornithine cyclodeaminase/alanine dehydrogenase-like protein (mu-crystallin family)
MARGAGYRRRLVSGLPVLSYDAVLEAVSPADAIARVREGFLRHHAGEWAMPSKVYLESPGLGDFRAMPARGDGLALLKWITSFPGNPALGLPTVTGLVCLSDLSNGSLLALLDARSVTALRTGAVAAVASRALARSDASSVGVVGCGLHGLWAARCLAADGWTDGVCFDVSSDAASACAREVGWRAGSLQEALSADVVCFVTPGSSVVLDAPDVRPGAHLNMLGADGPGKAEASVEAVQRCALFCDEWAQASHGGELTGAVEAGRVSEADVTALGAVLAGEAPGRTSEEETTLFDSTGLAIQDLAVAGAAYAAWRDGAIDAPVVEL